MPPQQIAIIALNIFFSYAHEDEVLRKELEKQLSILRWLGLITEWYDRDIHAGTEWEHEINAHLDTAQIILLLISPDFLASPYCLLQHRDDASAGTSYRWRSPRHPYHPASS